MLNGMALTFECVNKIIGSGGGDGVSKGADSKIWIRHISAKHKVI